MNIIGKHVGKARTGDVVVRSMISSQLSCILASIAPQLVIILNGLIISRFLGTECFKAISVFNPISGMVLILINLCCIGPSIQAGKAYGELDIQKADRLFSLASLMAGIIGILPALALFAFRGGIAEMMTPDQGLQGHLVAYISPVCLYLLLSAIACILNTFINASGYVKKVTQAVIASGIMNIASIFILIRIFHCGAEAAGIAMCISALTNIVFLLPFVLGKQFPFRLVAPDSNIFSLVKDNISVWISVYSGSLSEGIFAFLINIVILHLLPSDGLFIWGICQMAITIIVFISSGIDDAYLYVEAFLMGEGDNAGRLKIAKSFLCEITIVLVLFATVFTLFPEKFAILFGADTPQLIETAAVPLICVAWFAALKDLMLLFGIFSIQRRPMVKLGYDLAVAVATPAMVLLAASLLGGANLWLGFAFTPLLLASYIVIVNAVCCRKDKNLIPFFLFNRINDVVTLDVSIDYSMGNMQEELSRVRTFLNICEISDTLAGKIELCCEELMANIQGMRTRGSTYDLRLSDCEDCVSLVVKNLGRPASPVINNGIVNDFLEKGTIPGSRELSLYYIVHCSDKVDYRYVYGMNVVYFSFSKK